MPVSAATLSTLMKKGLSGDDLIEVVDAIDSDYQAAAPARTARQERNRRHYAKAKASESVLIQTSDSDATPPSSLPPSPPPRDINSTPPLPPEPPSPTRALRAIGRKAFDEGFWPVYPKRVGSNPRFPAREKFLALVEAGEDPEEIIAGAKAYARTFGGEPSQFVKLATTWLKQRCWEDCYTNAAATGPPQLSVVGSMPQQGWNATAGMYYAVRDSDQWVAWYEHRKATTGKGVSTDKHGGWYFPTEWPPKQEAAE